MPIHLKRICSAIDQLPADVNFGVLGASKLQSAEASRLPQDSGGLLPEQSSVELASQIIDDGGVPPHMAPQTNTPEALASQRTEQAALKRLKRKHNAM